MGHKLRLVLIDQAAVQRLMFDSYFGFDDVLELQESNVIRRMSCGGGEEQTGRWWWRRR